MAQTVKNPPAMQETWVQPLGQEDPLEKGRTNHSRILNLENSTDREATVSKQTVGRLRD